jgi:hypothetical protein
MHIYIHIYLLERVVGEVVAVQVVAQLVHAEVAPGVGLRDKMVQR